MKIKLNNHELIINNGIISPTDAFGDEVFGLTRGTNGTGAEARRLLAELLTGASSWRQSNGQFAIGPNLRYRGEVEE